jgi:predicted DNA-binding protein
MLGVNMPKKSSAKVAGKRADQYMLRFSEGMRDRLAKLAGANGRSMNAEILEAVEKHLEGADRVTQLWEVFEKHRKNIEALDSIRGAVEELERAVGGLTDGEFYGRLRRTREDAEREAREASMPPITAEQAAVIRGLLKEARTDEARLLAYMEASSIEAIRDFEKAASALEDRRRFQQAADTPEAQPSPHKGHRGD